MSAIYDRETDSIYISSAELCEFVSRGGDIGAKDSRGNKNGCTVVSHKLWQKKPNILDSYAFTTISDGTKITVFSYPECLHKMQKGYSIDYIYTVDYSLDIIDNGQLEIALKTAACTGYIMCERLGLTEIEANVSFYREGSDEERSFSQTISYEDLKGNFELLIALFSPFAKIIKEKGTNVVDQLASLRFPFDGGPREGQRDFIIDTFRAIKSRKRLVVQAPTGIGKTMASLYPALKSIGCKDADKVFYFTGKTTTALAALNAIDIMRNQIPDLRSIHISSKDKCCVSFKPGSRRKCEPRFCHRTKSYFDKINVAILDLLENYRTYTKEIIDEIAQRYDVCSYELSLELSEWCELVVCDYNYLFDLNAYLRRYFEIPPEADYIFLFDESHNLPDRAREMYSVTLLKSDFERIKNKYPQVDEFTVACQGVLSEFDTYHQLAMSEKTEINDTLCGFYINSQLNDDFVLPYLDLIEGCKKVFRKKLDDDELNEIYLNLKKLRSVCEIYDKRFTTYIEAIGDEVKLRIMCLDPSYMLDTCMKKGICSVLFSATLTPLEYFSDVLGCEKSNTLSLKSPFDPANQCLICISNVSTRYDDRDKSALNVANIIRAMIAGKSGNYIVYFPSYSYLMQVMEIFKEKYPKIPVTAQSRSMSEKAKKDFLDSFDEKKEGTLVGFCVMGGSFSEGIDLRGERLIGAMIVGVGLPTVSSELNIVKEYFDKTRENGYAYTYTYPGMNKVLQAAGRVIRSDDERGVVLLVDDRFASPEYRMIIPEYWNHMKYLTNARDLLDTVTKFWKK